MNTTASTLADDSESSSVGSSISDVLNSDEVEASITVIVSLLLLVGLIVTWQKMSAQSTSCGKFARKYCKCCYFVCCCRLPASSSSRSGNYKRKSMPFPINDDPKPQALIYLALGFFDISSDVGWWIEVCSVQGFGSDWAFWAGLCVIGPYLINIIAAWLFIRWLNKNYYEQTINNAWATNHSKKFLALVFLTGNFEPVLQLFNSKICNKQMCSMNLRFKILNSHSKWASIVLNCVCERVPQLIAQIVYINENPETAGGLTGVAFIMSCMGVLATFLNVLTLCSGNDNYRSERIKLTFKFEDNNYSMSQSPHYDKMIEYVFALRFVTSYMGVVCELLERSFCLVILFVLSCFVNVCEYCRSKITHKVQRSLEFGYFSLQCQFWKQQSTQNSVYMVFEVLSSDDNRKVFDKSASKLNNILHNNKRLKRDMNSMLDDSFQEFFGHLGSGQINPIRVDKIYAQFWVGTNLFVPETLPIDTVGGNNSNNNGQLEHVQLQLTPVPSTDVEIDFDSRDDIELTPNSEMVTPQRTTAVVVPMTISGDTDNDERDEHDEHDDPDQAGDTETPDTLKALSRPNGWGAGSVTPPASATTEDVTARLPGGSGERLSPISENKQDPDPMVWSTSTGHGDLPKASQLSQAMSYTVSFRRNNNSNNNGNNGDRQDSLSIKSIHVAPLTGAPSGDIPAILRAVSAGASTSPSNGTDGSSQDRNSISQVGQRLELGRSKTSFTQKSKKSSLGSKISEFCEDALGAAADLARTGSSVAINET